MNPEKKQELLIIRRTRGGSDFHHGGAWKIAFADFMTAMMALFLVLWLVAATNEKTKASLARYFNPVNLVDMTTMKRGIHDPNQGTTTEGKDSTASQSKSESEPETAPEQGKAQQGKGNPGPGSTSAVERPPTHSETALFRDPYAVLAEIAASEPENPIKSSDQSDDGTGNGDTVDAYKDPFKSATPLPTGPQNASPQPTTSAAASVPPANTPSPVAAKSVSLAEAQQPPIQLTASPPPNAANASKNQLPPAQSAKLIQQSQPQTEANKLKGEIANLVGPSAKGEAAPNIEIKATDEGVLIQLTDATNFAMFAIGSAEPQPKTVKVMEKIGEALKKEKGTIVIGGHTDGRPYKSATYDNWRLSSARAQMAYYMLVRGGVDEKRVERIEGYADRKLKVPNNPLADENRRIEIFLRKDKS
jgi:chemotaxis protein MotB